MPNARKMTAWSGRIQASVCHMSESCGSCRSMLARSKYRPPQATAAAQKSCTKASQTRQLALTLFKPHSSPTPMILDRCEYKRENDRPNDEQHDAGGRRPSQHPKTRACNSDHQPRIECQRSPVPPADLHQSLIVMFPMRFPDARSPQQPIHQGRRRVRDERQEDQYRKPRRPPSFLPSRDTEDCGEEAQWNGADIAQKDAGGGCIAKQEGDHRRDQCEEECRRSARCQPCCGGIGAKSDDGHRSRQSVAAVHEIVEIRHPDDRQNGGYGVERRTGKP